MENYKTFRVESGDWKDEVDVDVDIFTEYGDQCFEAMTLSLERWLDTENDHMIALLVQAYEVEKGSSEKDYVALCEYVFQNLGRLDMVKLLRDEQTERYE